ncbi:MAG: hypothetical protein IJS50_04730 [Desulfovibrio sp.]|nr:hypothetical protein [Desulfovibrio sp.]
MDMPRYEFEQKDIPDVVTLEKLSEMPYQYADEAEREYYTKWKKDLIEKSEKIGEKNACIKVAKKLLALGMDIDKISIIT